MSPCKFMEDNWTFTFGREMGKMMIRDTCQFWTEANFHDDRDTSPLQFWATCHQLEGLGRPAVTPPTFNALGGQQSLSKPPCQRRPAQGHLSL